MTGERIRTIRETQKLTQAEFAEKLNTTRDRIANYELGRVKPDISFLDYICKVFDVNFEWLRTGKGEMFTVSSDFSLDELIKKHNLSDIKVDIIKAFIELDNDICEALITHFKKIFNTYDTVKKDDAEFADEISIDKEVESYRKELEAEKNSKTSSASELTKENAG